MRSCFIVYLSRFGGLVALATTTATATSSAAASSAAAAATALIARVAFGAAFWRFFAWLSRLLKANGPEFAIAERIHKFFLRRDVFVEERRALADLAFAFLLIAATDGADAQVARSFQGKVILMCGGAARHDFHSVESFEREDMVAHRVGDFSVVGTRRDDRAIMLVKERDDGFCGGRGVLGQALPQLVLVELIDVWNHANEDALVCGDFHADERVHALSFGFFEDLVTVACGENIRKKHAIKLCFFGALERVLDGAFNARRAVGLDVEIDEHETLMVDS